MVNNVQLIYSKTTSFAEDTKVTQKIETEEDVAMLH